MGKASMIMVIGSIAIFLVVNMNLNDTVTSATERAITQFDDFHVRNMANSYGELLLAKLGSDNTYRVSTRATANFFNGTVGYRVVDTTLDSESLIKIAIDAVFDEDTLKTEVYTKAATGGFFPTTVKAAITTNNNVNTLGNIKVDGRQHDINGNLIANSGTLGIWTTGSFTRSGNSKIGGTHDSTDIAPKKTGISDIYEDGETWPGGYPDNPDSVLGGVANGLPQGTLKSIAQSGASGSQYVTSPGSLTYPLKAITYVELASGDEWNAANITGSGILIVHNSSTNAVIKNLNTGPFVGLIIADDIVHIHTTIIGAIIGLTPSPSEGNCIGNGNGDVLFSSEAIEEATKYAGTAVDEYGFGKKRLSIIAWYE